MPNADDGFVVPKEAEERLAAARRVNPLDDVYHDADYLDTDNVARRLGVHRETVLRHFRDGTLAGRKVGHGWRTTTAALDRFVEGHNPTSGEPHTRGGTTIETKDGGTL